MGMMCPLFLEEILVDKKVILGTNLKSYGLTWNYREPARNGFQCQLVTNFLESPNTDMLLRDLLLITHHYTQSNSKTS